MRLYWVRVGRNPMVSVFIKRDLDTETHREECDKRGRDQNNASTSQGTPSVASNPQKLVRGKKGPFQGAVRQNLAQSPKCEGINFCCLKPPKFVVIIMAALETKIIKLNPDLMPYMKKKKKETRQIKELKVEMKQ